MGTSIGATAGLFNKKRKDATGEAKREASVVAVQTDAAQKESDAQTAARQAQADQLAARRRAKRFAFGYDREEPAGGLGGTGAATGRKTLLGS